MVLCLIHLPPVQSAADLICAALRGESHPWPWEPDSAAIKSFHQHANLHGIGSLLHSRVRARNWPAQVTERLKNQAVTRAMWELRHQQVLTETLALLDSQRIHPVLIKGTALAYSLYDDPVLRTRGDTDLIIPIEAKSKADIALMSLGFERDACVTGRHISYQCSYTLATVDGGSHTLDLHWKINNSEVLSRLFTYEELRQQARPLAALCPHAQGASPVHALLLACMHRSTHKQNPYYVDGVAHYEGNRAIWLYDIHLLADRLTPQDWGEFTRLARTKGLRAVCLEGMQLAGSNYGTAYPVDVVASLTEGAREPVAEYLAASKLRQQWMDFCALGSHTDRMGFARELLFPPASYMRGKYHSPRCGWLPWLYFVRAATGVHKAVTTRRSQR